MPYRNTALVTSTRRIAATQFLAFSVRPARAQGAHRDRPPAHARQRAGWISCLAIALAGPALAADTPQFGEEALVAMQTDNRSGVIPAAYEVNSVSMPQLGDMNWGPQRLGSASGFANATQHLDVTRWLTPDAPRSVGFSLGVTSPAPSASALANASNFNSGATAPTSLDLGVRWRSRIDSRRHVDVSAWAQTPQWAQPSPDAMGLIWQQQQPVYGTRVEMQWASSRTRGLVPEFGAIGVQLQGSSRLVLRARKGGPMVYYRAKF